MTELPDDGPESVDHRSALVAELHTVARIGVLGLRASGPKAPRLSALDHSLARAGTRTRPPWLRTTDSWPPDRLESLLRAALSGLDSPEAALALAFVFGIASGSRGWKLPRRRAAAGRQFEVGEYRFRTFHEKNLIEELADILLALNALPAAPAHLSNSNSGNDNDGKDNRGSGGSAAHTLPETPVVLAPRSLWVPIGNRSIEVTVHHRSISQLADIDVLVSPENIYFEVASLFKSSVSAALRRAAAVRGPAGDLRDDVVLRELAAWLAENAAPGLAVAPGTVAATSAGALRDQGIRRIYHAAVTVPRTDNGNEYDVSPSTVTLAATSTFRLARQENATTHDPPLASICFPLLGAGRGGLAPRVSFEMIWNAVVDEARRHAPPKVHFVARRADQADLIARWVAAADA